MGSAGRMADVERKSSEKSDHNKIPIKYLKL